jgi:tagatose 1,6-diphosphate aldolase
MYGGHIGYAVDLEHRGHHYAERACRLVLALAKAHGLDTIWITCNPDNVPSRRTCERLDATLVEIVRLPEDSDMYQEGDREKCRYRVDLG